MGYMSEIKVSVGTGHSKRIVSISAEEAGAWLEKLLAACIKARDFAVACGSDAGDELSVLLDDAIKG